MKNIFYQILIVLAIAVISLSCIYGCYWVAKTFSYNFWYKGMVRYTVIEMVKQEALR